MALYDALSNKLKLDRAINTLNPILQHRTTITTTLATLGGLWTLSHLFSLSSAIHVHFFRRDGLSRYQFPGHDAPSSWALITGASDGIGKGFAQELCARGFNVILHGRNEKKLEAVRAELLKEFEGVEVEILVLDATNPDVSSPLEAAVNERFKDLDLKILVNNVAFSPLPLLSPLEKRSAEAIQQTMDASATFAMQITRAFLPLLKKKNSKHPSAAILNIGSGISDLPAPFLTTLAAAKAALAAFSRALAVEMRTQDSRIEVLLLQVGKVASGSSVTQREISLAVPGPREFARRCLAKVGCGRDEVWGYWVHGVMFSWLMGSGGGVVSWVKEGLVRGMVRGMMMEEEEEEEEEGRGGAGGGGR